MKHNYETPPNTFLLVRFGMLAKGRAGICHRPSYGLPTMAGAGPTGNFIRSCAGRACSFNFALLKSVDPVWLELKGKPKRKPILLGEWSQSDITREMPSSTDSLPRRGFGFRKGRFRQSAAAKPNRRIGAICALLFFFCGEGGVEGKLGSPRA